MVKQTVVHTYILFCNKMPFCNKTEKTYWFIQQVGWTSRELGWMKDRQSPKVTCFDSIYGAFLKWQNALANELVSEVGDKGRVEGRRAIVCL